MLTISLSDSTDSSVAEEYVLFISSGTVSLLRFSVETPVSILRDTGAAQSLILEHTLPNSLLNGNEVMLQGVELGHVSVLLRNIYLKCDVLQ